MRDGSVIELEQLRHKALGLELRWYRVPPRRRMVPTGRVGRLAMWNCPPMLMCLARLDFTAADGQRYGEADHSATKARRDLYVFRDPGGEVHQADMLSYEALPNSSYIKTRGFGLIKVCVGHEARLAVNSGEMSMPEAFWNSGFYDSFDDEGNSTYVFTRDITATPLDVTRFYESLRSDILGVMPDYGDRLIFDVFRHD